MHLIPFRLDSTRPPVDPTAARLLADVLEEEFARATWAEHSRVHSARGGVLGVVFCRASQERQAREGLRAVLSAVARRSGEPGDWRPGV